MHKKGTQEKGKEALEKAIKDFRKAMEQVHKTWPSVVEELGFQVDTSATETAYLAGYSEAKKYDLPDDLRAKRGDHVATRTLYKVNRG